MIDTGKVSSSSSKVGKSDTLLAAAVKGIPPMLQRFYKFTREMSQKFSRHLEKDRTDEFVNDVIKEFKNVG